jgi:hypothetical protein
MTDTHDAAGAWPGEPDRPGHQRSDLDAATEGAIDVAVMRALEHPATAPLPQDFARRVATAATVQGRGRRRARRSARVTWIGLAAIVLLLFVMAPALAPAATAVFAPLARTLGPMVTAPAAALILVAGPVLWTLGHASQT